MLIENKFHFYNSRVKEKKEPSHLIEGEITYPKGVTSLDFARLEAGGGRFQSKTVRRLVLVMSIEEAVAKGERLTTVEADYYNIETGEWSEEFYNRFYRRKKES